MQRKVGLRTLALSLMIAMLSGLFYGLNEPVLAGAQDVAVNTTSKTTYGDVSAALNAALDGETVKLVANAAPLTSIVFDRNGVGVTLDLNGYSVVRDAGGVGGETGTSSTIFVEAGTLTIQDTSPGGNGYIQYINTPNWGSGLNVGANGVVHLRSGGIIGAGQGVFAHDAGARFNMSGGLVYGYYDANGSEALDAMSGAYVTVSGGYLGTFNASAAMIWSGSTLDPVYWSITGGYFTSDSYNDGALRPISSFVPAGQVTLLEPTVKHLLSGNTEYRYHLTTPRTVTFDPYGGSVDPASAVTDISGKLDSLPAAGKGALVFRGWYASPWAGGEAITTDTVFSQDTTVYARYQGGYAPSIDVQPASVSKTASLRAELTVSASLPADSPGGSTLSYRWLKSEDGGATWRAIDGAVDASYTTPALGLYDDGVQYRAVVRNDYDDSEVVSDAATVQVVAPAAPVLTAVGDNVNNLVKLNWTSSLAGQEYYMVYQKEAGGDELDDFQSIPLNNDIKVLNVYPDVSGSDGLQVWMMGEGGVGGYGSPGEYKMQVDKVAISDFNGADPNRNYAHYLTKNVNGAYEYDVLYFGAWDVNGAILGGHDLSADSYAAVEAFIQYGGGVLVGHDTASFAHSYFIDLAEEHLNMDVNFQEGNSNPAIPPLGSDRVVIQRRGFPMNYPYALGDIGEILETPLSHSYYQFAKGDVWFKYTDISWGSLDKEINEYQHHKGTNNFYLTTWNNAAMIQTGHSNGQATVDEQKILANTLYYLAQTSTANSFDDRMSQDVAAPDPVSGSITVSAGAAVDKRLIQWNAAEDRGSTYSYSLKSFSFSDNSSRESAETTATVTTGIQGYAVLVDTDSSNADPGNTVTTSTYSYETSNLQPGVTYYAHIKAIDRAGNASAVYTVSFTVDAAGLTVTATDPSGIANDGKTRLAIAETVGPGNKLVYLNAGSGDVAVPGIGDELDEHSGYRELPESGLAEAADGDKIAVAEVDADGRVVRFGQTLAVVAPAPAALAVTSVDPAGAALNGKTQMVANAGSGNKLVYVNFGTGEVLEPSLGQALGGYTDLPADGLIDAANGDRIGIAEVDADGKVVRYGAAAAQVWDEAAAKGLTAAATDPAGAGTDGKTQVTASASEGNKLVYVNFKQQPANIPNTGSSINGLGYEELSASGLAEADNGDLLGIAEIDPAGNVVRYTTVPAVVAPESAAKGLQVGTKDAVGIDNDGKTQITGSVSEGHKLVYINFGAGPATAPTTGQPAGGGYADVPEDGAIAAGNGDILGVAEVDELGNVVKFGTVRAAVTPESAAQGLPVAATEAGDSGSAGEGKTKVVSKAAEGNKLVYVNFGEGPVNVPGTGDTLAGYEELPGNGLVAAKPGDKIGVAEVGPDGKVVKYGVTEAVVAPQIAAKRLDVTSVDPTGAGTDGKTKLGTAVGTTVGADNKLVYFNAGKGAVSTPEAGSILTGYAELPADGLVDARNGDRIGIAEVDAAGKVVRFGPVTAVVRSEAVAKGLEGSAADPTGAGTDGKTKLEAQTPIGAENKVVYLNFGKGAVLEPDTGDTLNGYTELPANGLVDAANGDRIGIAEVDATGKVVKFGLVEAAVAAESAAKGLTPVSVDPTGAANDGKTQVTASAGSGNKLVYVNFGAGDVLVPDTGEILSGYTDLPGDGLLRARHGDKIAVAEVDAEGRVVRFGVVTAQVVDYSNEFRGGTAASGLPASQGVEVLVNGKVEYAGTATPSTVNGQTQTTIDVDQAKLQAKLDAEGDGAVVTIPWPKQSDIVVGQLTGQMVKNMEDKRATLVLDTPSGAYYIPTEQIRIAALAQQYGDQVQLENVTLQIHIALATSAADQAAERLGAQAGFTLMAVPVTFTVNAVYEGKSIEITDFSKYVKRTVALPADIDPDKITTGVVLEPDGTLRHVPTQVIKLNETYYAQINSLTNSDYGVIWNPMEFDDVAAHWSKDAVNDMGSRLVVSGVGGGAYDPDRDITRAEFAAIMVRGLGLRLEKGNVPFADVTGKEWYAGAVSTAFKFGLIAGYEDGTFQPQKNITRQEAMTILARAMAITGLKDKLVNADLSEALRTYQDADAVANWAEGSVRLAVAAGLVYGRTATSLEAASFITRAEVSAIMQRLLRKSELI